MNLLAGIASVAGLIARAAYADQIAADPQVSEDLAFLGALTWLGALWLAAAVLAFWARQRAGLAEQDTRVWAAMGVAVVTTVTLPVLVPVGLIVAFQARWKRCAPYESVMRLWGGLGGLAGVLAVALVWSDADSSTFLSAYNRWPPGLQEWWDSNWPPLLDAGFIAQNTPTLQIYSGVIAVLALAGVWWGYSTPDPAPRILTAVGVLGLGLAVALVLPYVATVVAIAAYIALIIGLVVGALALAAAIWVFCSS
jgi:hypothetical protein